jgi:hypothetical protein
MSRTLLEKINDFTITHNKLTFIEVLFPTLVEHNNLTSVNPYEFKYVDFYKTYDISQMDASMIYHPVKDVALHEKLRNSIN